MSRNQIFEIEVLNWEKHNAGRLKGKIAFTHFMLANRFFDDSKIQKLTTSEKLVFIAVLSRCADERRAKVELSASQIRAMCGLRTSDVRAMVYALQENQLVRVLKSPVLIREEKIKEEKVKVNSVRHASSKIENEKSADAEPTKPNPAAPAATSATDAKNFISFYCELWKTRHGSNPDITGKDAGIAKRLAASLSARRAEELLQAFFKIPDAFIIKAKHPLTLFELKIKEIGAFADSGKFVTQSQAIRADETAESMSQLERIRKGLL